MSLTTVNNNHETFVDSSNECNHFFRFSFFKLKHKLTSDESFTYNSVFFERNLAFDLAMKNIDSIIQLCVETIVVWTVTVPTRAVWISFGMLPCLRYWNLFLFPFLPIWECDGAVTKSLNNRVSCRV